MTSVSELIRSRAVQIGEIRRTGSQDLASKLLRDLFLIAEGVEVGTPVPEIADQLSDGLGIPPALGLLPSDSVSRYPYLATFQGQAWIKDVAVTVDDAQFSFPVSETEALEAARISYPADLVDAKDLDRLQTAAGAPQDVRSYSGPFEITLERRRYRIEGDDGGTAYADDIRGVRVVLAALFVRASTDGAVSANLMADIHGITEEHLEGPGTCVRLGAPGLLLAVRQQVQDLEFLADAEPAC